LTGVDLGHQLKSKVGVDTFERALAAKAGAEEIDVLKEKILEIQKQVRLTNLFLNESFKLQLPTHTEPKIKIQNRISQLIFQMKPLLLQT
jgi:hypothetical protein